MIYLGARFFFGERELGVCEKVAEIQYAGRKERERTSFFFRPSNGSFSVYMSPCGFLRGIVQWVL